MKYQIFYMDNDGQKRVVKTCTGYDKTIKTWQTMNADPFWQYCDLKYKLI